MPPMQKYSPSSLPQWLKSRQRLQLTLLFFVGFFITYLLVALLILRLYRQQVEITLQEYGNTIVHQLAQTSVDALLRNDRLSLHAQLENLTNAPNIVEVGIYDMENRLIAQAADSAYDEDYLRHYPATITFQDSIVGKAIIGLDTRPLLKNHHWLYGYLFCGLVLSFLVTLAMSRAVMHYGNSLYRRLIRGIHYIQPHITSDLAENENTQVPSMSGVEKNIYQLQEYLQQLEQGAPIVKFTQTGKSSYQPPQGSYAELLIECVNFEALQQQVHHRELQRLLETLQSVIQQASELYHADDVHSPGNHILLRFQHNDITDAALQAICCAVVIRNLVQAITQDASIKFQLRFAIHWHEHDDRPIADLMRNHLLLQEQQELQRLCSLAKPNEVLVSKGIKRSTGVAEHIKLELISGDSDVDFYRVQRLSDNYKKLLEQQALQLANNVDALSSMPS